MNNNTTSKHSEKQSTNYNKSYNSANSFHNKRDYSNANQQSTKKYFESTNQPNEQRQSQPLKSFKPKFAKSLSNFVQIENQNTKDSYENLKKKLEACSLDANKNLIETVQELNDLYDVEHKLGEVFSRDSLRVTITNKLFDRTSNVNLDKDEFLTIANYMVRFEPKKFSRLSSLINTISTTLNADQLVNLLYVLRSPRLYGENVRPLINESTRLLRSNLNEIEKFSNILQTIKMFPLDDVVIKQLDYKILQSKEKLNNKDWIDLLNTKSILRHRNITVIETCAYSLINNKASLDLESIQKIFLSCGVLNYIDEQFLKYLSENLLNVLEKNKSNANWLHENESNLLSIICSIGMLQIRDKKLIDAICKLLAEQKSVSNKLVMNLVVSCGFLRYQPSDKKSFDSLTSQVKLENLSTASQKDKLLYLNYVWSSCILDNTTNEILGLILDENFWSELIDDKNKYLKSIITKLMQINLYAQLFHDSYNGPFLPPQIDAANYTALLKPEHDSLSDQLVSTLTSFRTIDKYFKTNLLTPFGIYIDALMVVDDKGIVCPFGNYFNENSQLETKSDKEKKIAIKIAEFKDKTRINNKINGNLLLQLILLKELGYTPVIITQSELSEPSVIKRIELIKRKLEKASRKSDEIYIE